MRRSIRRPWLALLLILGCGDDVRGDADETGDSDSDGSAGAEDGPGGDPVDPIPDTCERFLECVDRFEDALHVGLRGHRRRRCRVDPVPG